MTWLHPERLPDKELQHVARHIAICVEGGLLSPTCTEAKLLRHILWLTQQLNDAVRGEGMGEKDG